MQAIQGIHHVTAMAGDPQRNLGFYVGVLGLRLVKRTVNFDDPATYHFYFADHLGTPGTVMTFFPWKDAPRGRSGAGMTQATAFAIPADALGFWSDRLASQGVEVIGREERFEETALLLHDPDGLPLELVASRAHDAMTTHAQHRDIPEQHALRGFHGVSLCVNGYEQSARLLTEAMGFEHVGELRNRFRFRAKGQGVPGQFVDLLCSPDAPRALPGVGTVHHVAFRVADVPEQERWRKELSGHGLNTTPVLDRQYFKSIYFREPGGILYEFATDGPGFATDEPVESLGRSLKLPSWLEIRRDLIERVLPAIQIPEGIQP